MKFPEHIRIQRIGAGFSLTIDGQEFPFQVAAVDTSMEPEDLPAVTVKLFARRLEVTDAPRSLE